MVVPQSRIRLQDYKGEALVLRVSPTRRLVFAGVALLLFTAFLVTLDAERDLRGSNVFGTVFYFALIGGSLAVALYDDRKVFHRRRRELLIESTLAGVQLRRRRVAFDDIRRVVLQMRKLERPADGTMVGVPDDPEAREEEPALIGGKRVLYVLSVETTDNQRCTLESSSLRDELDEVGRSLAHFLEVPFEASSL